MNRTQLQKRISFQDGTPAEDRIVSIRMVEKEITESKEPAVSLLKSLLAVLYWEYYDYYQWDVRDRTAGNFNKEDIATWTAEDFYRKVIELYLGFISHKSILQQTRLRPYDAIIQKGNTRHLRPTLYDLVAHQALDFFKGLYNGFTGQLIVKPSYAFEIDQEEAFAPAARFVLHPFLTKDSSPSSTKPC